MELKFDRNIQLDEFIEKIIQFTSTIPKFNDLSEVSSYFLNIFSAFSETIFSSLYILNNNTYEFEHFQTISELHAAESESYFDFLVDNGTIGNAVGNRTVVTDDEIIRRRVFNVSPLINSGEIVGLIVVFSEPMPQNVSLMLYYALSLLSPCFASAIKVQEYVRKEKENEIIFEQRIAERTMNLLKSKAEMHEKFGDLRTNLTMALPHEIRTPIGMILGNSDFLNKNISLLDPEDVTDITKDLYKSAKRINDLFENYIYFANLELIAIDPVALENLQASTLTHPARLLEDFSNVISNRFDRVNDLRTNLSEAEICFSEQHFIKLINELLDNAFKYSNKGDAVILEAYIIEDSMFISIIDHGRGMTQEQISGIDAYIQFERFKYEQQGLGLGLAIVRRIINLHKGELKIESEYEKFTKISIKVRLATI